jgi:hypothetical protein
MNKEYKYIYNSEQANFYMQHNIMTLGTGINPKTNMVWYKFSTEETQEVYYKWCALCRERRSQSNEPIS